MLIFKKIILASALVFSLGTAYAASFDQPCPSADELLDFDSDFLLDLPINYDSTAKTINHALMQAKGIGLAKKDLFILSGIQVSRSQSTVEVSKNLIKDLVPETEYPIAYVLTRHLSVPLCSYVLPNQEHIKGLYVSVAAKHEQLLLSHLPTMHAQS